MLFQQLTESSRQVLQYKSLHFLLSYTKSLLFLVHRFSAIPSLLQATWQGRQTQRESSASTSWTCSLLSWHYPHHPCGSTSWTSCFPQRTDYVHIPKTNPVSSWCMRNHLRTFLSFVPSHSLLQSFKNALHLKAGPPAHCQPHCPLSSPQALIKGCIKPAWGKHLFSGGFAPYPQGSLFMTKQSRGSTGNMPSDVLSPRSHVAPGRKGTAAPLGGMDLLSPPSVTLSYPPITLHFFQRSGK